MSKQKYNRIKAVLVESGKTNNWLADQLYHLHFKFSQLKCAFFACLAGRQALASIEKTTVGPAMPARRSDGLVF